MQTKIVLIAETIENRLPQSHKELLGFARSFFPENQHQILMLISGKNVKNLAEQIAKEHDIHVIALEHDDLLFPNPHILTKSLPEILIEFKPEYICMSHNVRSCQIAASLSIDMNAACLTGVESFKFIKGHPVYTRSLFGGKLISEMSSQTSPTIVTITPEAFSASLKKKSTNRIGKSEVIKLKNNYSEFSPKAVIETIQNDNLLEEADVIVSAGMGIQEEENINLIKQAASMFSNAAIAGSRIVCDHGWLPYTCQIGETGKSVSPKLYIACGISGTMQHIIGMKKSKCIVAINTDPKAPIFNVADYGIIENLSTFLPILIAKYDDLYHK